MHLGDRLERRAVEALAGRRAELERPEGFALGDEPLVMHIQGIPRPTAHVGLHLQETCSAQVAELTSPFAVRSVD
jgi:hypothetical protein